MLGVMLQYRYNNTSFMRIQNCEFLLSQAICSLSCTTDNREDIMNQNEKKQLPKYIYLYVARQAMWTLCNTRCNKPVCDSWCFLFSNCINLTTSVL